MRWPLLRRDSSRAAEVPAGSWDEVDWAAVPGPEFYLPKTVPKAFRAFFLPEQPGGTDAMALMRRAVGNDHRGSIYPAAVPAAEHLLRIVQEHPGDPRRGALCVLIEWWGGYYPEAGYERFRDPAGTEVDLQEKMMAHYRDATPVLRRVSDDASDPVAAELAGELLACMAVGWGAVLDDEDGVARIPAP